MIKKISLSICILICVTLGTTNSQNALIDLHVSNGKSTEHIELSWNSIYGRDEYRIYRSDRMNGNFGVLKTINNTLYLDTNCKPGIEYFYKVSSEPHLKDTDYSVQKSGYRRIDLSTTYELDKLLSEKKQPVTYLRPIDKKRTKQLEKYYIGWFKTQIILFVTKPYLYNDKITVLTDFHSFSYNPEQNSIEFYSRNETYRLLFYGREPFELLDSTGDEQLLKRLLENSIALCVYQGETKIRDRMGRNKYIPKYEAVGLLTTYFKYDKSWASKTILFSSNRKDIIQEVEQR